MTRQMHLNQSGNGMSARTACGRNVLRTPMSADWADFKVATHRCIKCEQSKTFTLRMKAEAEKQAELDKWEPEAPDAWMKQDDALKASRKK